MTVAATIAGDKNVVQLVNHFSFRARATTFLP